MSLSDRESALPDRADAAGADPSHGAGRTPCDPGAARGVCPPDKNARARPAPSDPRAVFPFDGPASGGGAATAPIARRAPAGLASVGLFYVGRRWLGETCPGDARALVPKLAELVAGHGFPPPLPSFRKGFGIVDYVHAASRWDRAAADRWFDGPPPPAAEAPLPDHELQRHADTLDARAEAMAA